MSNEKNCNGLTYSEWMKRANKRVSDKIGLSLDDLPDGLGRLYRPLHDAWSEGEEPEDYADNKLWEEGYDCW
jgi:hypothetical protein